jgi:hypothetical protein
MKQRRITCDKTELVLSIELKNRYTFMNLTYADIARIQIDEIIERKFLVWSIPSESITVTTTKQEKPIVYKKKKEKQFWDEYKTDLEKFCKTNNVSFTNTIGGD